MKCIAHGGASAVAPPNTIRSFELAQDLGADAVEFDVRLHGGRVVVAHTVLDAFRPGRLELGDAVRWLAERTNCGLELIVDLKTRGTERPAVETLRAHGLLERSTFTSQVPALLRGVREADPGARCAIAVAGRASRFVAGWREWREELATELRAGRYTAVMAHRRLVDADLVDRVRGAGAELHAWTVRHAGEATRLADLGVDGIVTPDPRVVAGRAPAYVLA
jgi:glycerophosphoryl diester phosphodiesterase